MDRKSLETIYQTFIRSKLEYACIIWDDCSKQDSLLLEKCQLRAARIVTGAKRGTHHQFIHDELKWVSLRDRREYFKLCFMHKVIHHTAPDYLIQLLPNAVNVDTHYNLRNSEDLQQFTFRTEKFKNSLFPDCVRKWNSLDTNVKYDCSIASFKSMINITEKSSELYYLGIRKFNLIHAQLRMECSNQGRSQPIINVDALRVGRGKRPPWGKRPKPINTKTARRYTTIELI